MALVEWNGDTIEALLDAASFEGTQLAGEYLLGESTQIVPHEEGDLERSGQVTSDESTGIVAVSYDRPYAVRQHEDLTLRHDEGREAKYLEKPMNDVQVQGTMLAIIAKAAGEPLRGV
ncbi:hypothetical protein E1193_13460 [Micromonospora sp. KC606]|uniref:minor capsid protein n=1 Tax=Micromonospora sp. KC606 TaxID=2530379 RepID=UPI00104CC4E5|nr:minor capsid protein [Micromonospora sp. KC606]TDC81905.1 hypothetical protein E1193_13460 [Micromonospora sp. KC606]